MNKKNWVYIIIFALFFVLALPISLNRIFMISAQSQRDINTTSDNSNMMTERETLDYLFNYLYKKESIEKMTSISFETLEDGKNIGYYFSYDRNPDLNKDRNFLLSQEKVKDETFIIYVIGDHSVHADGAFYHNSISNHFAVNRITKEVIVERIDHIDEEKDTNNIEYNKKYMELFENE